MSEAGLQTPNLNFWDPMSQLKRVSHREIEYSKGFLRAQLPQWLPGLAMQWLTLTHTLGVEVKIISVEPTLSIPNDFDVIFAGKIGQEDIGVGASQEALLTLAEACIPGAKNIAQGILQEYLARRFLSSVVLAWGGPQIPEFSFQGIRDVSQMSIAGSVILRLQINSVQCSVFIFLGSKTIDLLDGMWRRQIRSAAGQTKSPGEVHLELAQLAVKPTSLVDYTRPGTVVDLEIPISDIITLRMKGGGSASARLKTSGEFFAFETLASAANNLILPEGTTRLSVELGYYPIESGYELIELMQPGSMLKTDISVSNTAFLVVNGERVGQAKVCSYEGRFAISVG